MRLFSTLVLILGSFLVTAQEGMTNEGVIKLVQSGLSESLVESIIRQQPGTYSLGAMDLVTLKEAGVSERLIAAMLDKGRSGAKPASGAAASGAASTPAASTPGGSPAITGKGLFYKKDNEYFELISEQVEWNTSGALKNIVSAGIVKKDLKGSVAGPSSRNFLRNPIEIVIAPPAGRNINSYVLVQMKPDDGVRKFNVGPVNKSSGVAKGAIPFGVEKVGEEQYRIVLPTALGPGEYGILGVIPEDAEGTSSKMYTFRILI
jgi:hypothetical protein